MPATEISIKGEKHAVVLPSSLIACWEGCNFLASAYAEGNFVRGNAAIIGLCFPSLRPPRLPAWNGEDMAGYAGMVADHLFSLGVSPKGIKGIIDATGIYEQMKARVPVDEEEVVEAEKNS